MPVKEVELPLLAEELYKEPRFRPSAPIPSAEAREGLKIEGERAALPL